MPDYEKLKELGSSEKISNVFSLEDLVTQAREYLAENKKLEESKDKLEKEIRALEMKRIYLQETQRAISFGGLLLNAIGLASVKRSGDDTAGKDFV